MRLISVSSWVPLRAVFFVSTYNSNAITVPGIKKGLVKTTNPRFFSAQHLAELTSVQAMEGLWPDSRINQAGPVAWRLISDEMMAAPQRSMLGFHGLERPNFWVAKK